MILVLVVIPCIAAFASEVEREEESEPKGHVELVDGAVVIFGSSVTCSEGSGREVRDDVVESEEGSEAEGSRHDDAISQPEAPTDAVFLADVVVRQIELEEGLSVRIPVVGAKPASRTMANKAEIETTTDGVVVDIEYRTSSDEIVERVVNTYGEEVDHLVIDGSTDAEPRTCPTKDSIEWCDRCAFYMNSQISPGRCRGTHNGD